MEENEIGNPWEFSKSIQVMSLIPSKITSDPLFSCVIAFCILVLLYFPHGFSLKIILSPILIITASILISLLRLGAVRNFQPDNRGNFSKTEETGFSDQESKKIQSFSKSEEIKCSDEEPNSKRIQSFSKSEETVFSDQELEKIQSFSEAAETEFSNEKSKKIQSFSKTEEREFSGEEPNSRKIHFFNETEETEFFDEEPRKIQFSSEAEETEFWEEGRNWVKNLDEAEETEIPDEEFERKSEFKQSFDFDPNPNFEPDFVEWNVSAPLDVIYEEEEEEKDENCLRRVIERNPVFSMYCSESDSDSSSEGGFPATWDKVTPGKMGFRWEEEDKDELIEIALGTKGLDFHGEEDNLIEIDISSSQKV